MLVYCNMCTVYMQYSGCTSYKTHSFSSLIFNLIKGSIGVLRVGGGGGGGAPPSFSGKRPLLFSFS